MDISTGETATMAKTRVPMSSRPKESWGTRLGVIMAVMGSAVGLGNFLRFPGLAAQYEGGAFMIPYFVALFLIGLPLAWGEWAMGRYGGERGFNSTPGIYRAIWRSRWSPYIGGVLGMLIPVGIFMYYVLIEAWCFGYAIYYLTGHMAELGRQAAQPGGGLNKQVYVDFFNHYVGAGAMASCCRRRAGRRSCRCWRVSSSTTS